ncbi:MAG: nuclear transport factor 2 family protein [Acidobacteriota bacterium]|nr:nuclear transport factor 2 family protein [Acidobacteriota bacterium]
MSELAVVEEFVRAYIAAWSTTDSAERRALIDHLYADGATFYADEPGDEPVQRHGRAEIEENITQVNQRLTQGNELKTESTGFVENHDLLRVSWKMTQPDGSIALTGMNVLMRDGDRRIVSDYIFIG